MEEKIKEIVSVFTKIPADQIGPATLIGRSTVQNSILLHRMYAKLAEEGLTVDNYGNIKTFADLLSHGSGKTSPINGNGRTGHSGTSLPVESVVAAVSVIPAVSAAMAPSPVSGIGIDIEEVAGLPRANDFRREEFYKMNFTAAEIAYCILQPDPYASFTGLFAAKEAIIKADGRHQHKIFNSIEITHSPEGKPVYPGFDLSISHAGAMAVAVAVPVTGGVVLSQAPGITAGSVPARGGGNIGALLLAGVALFLSIITLFIVFTHWYE